MPEGEGGSGGNSTANIEATVSRLLQKDGDRRAITKLLRDNFRQREELRTAKDRIAELEKRADVPEGGKILKADEAKQWDAYVALGKPEDLKAATEKKAELEAELAKRDLETTIAAAAEAAGFKADVLKKLPGAGDLKFEVKTEKVDGQDQQVPYVTPQKDGASAQKLSEYAELEWKDFLPSLQAEDGGNGGSGAPRAAGGQPFPRQSGQERPPKNGPLTPDEIVKRKRASGAYSL